MAIRKVINGEAINLDNGSGGGSITAADVSYDNTDSGLDATNAQDAIDELKSDLSDIKNNTNIGTPVNLGAYSSTNKFTFPDNGYVVLYAQGNTSDSFVHISGENGSGDIAMNCKSPDSAARINTLYVIKGMKVYGGGSNGGSAAYYPLVQ